MVKTLDIITLWLIGILTVFIIYSWVDSNYHENYRIESTELKAFKYNVTPQGAKLSDLKEIQVGDTLALFIKLNVRYIDTGLDDIGLALFLSPPPGADGPLDEIDKIRMFTGDHQIGATFGLTWADYKSKQRHDSEYLISPTREIGEFEDLYNRRKIDERTGFNYFVKVDSLVLNGRNVIMDIALTDNKTIRSNKVKW